MSFLYNYHKFVYQLLIKQLYGLLLFQQLKNICNYILFMIFYFFNSISTKHLYSKMLRRVKASVLLPGLVSTTVLKSFLMNRVTTLTTPSCVASNETELLVGEGAKNQMARLNTVFSNLILSIYSTNINLPFC